MTITYLIGDATQPVKKPALVIHVCNDIGGWGRGFVLALSKRSPEPEKHYRAMTQRDLGTVEFIRWYDGDFIVANMIAQHGIQHVYIDPTGPRDPVPPIRYEALANCLATVAMFVHEYGDGLSIHAPRIGCGLAGGSWKVVEPLIEHYLRDIAVYIYDLPKKPASK